MPTFKSTTLGCPQLVNFMGFLERSMISETNRERKSSENKVWKICKKLAIEFFNSGDKNSIKFNRLKMLQIFPNPEAALTADNDFLNMYKTMGNLFLKLVMN